MIILIALLEFSLVTLGLWALTFHVGLALHWPVQSVATSFFALLLPASLVMLYRLYRRVRSAVVVDWKFSAAVLALGLSIGVGQTFFCRPDADDVGYFHKYLLDVANPEEPFTVTPFGVSFGDERYLVPGLSENEVYDAMVATLSSTFSIDPLLAYHNLFPILVALLWTTVHALLFLRFRLGRRATLLALVAMTAFLLLDGNLHRTYGNMSLLRMWQGKVVAINVLLPALLWCAMRFFSRATKWRALLLLCVALETVLVNRSMLFVISVMITALIVVRLVGYGRWHKARDGLWLVGLLVGSAFAAGAYLYWKIASIDQRINGVFDAALHWNSSRDSRGWNWWQALNAKVIGGPTVLLRDAWLLLVVPWFLNSRPLRRFLPLLSLTAALLAFSPWTGAVWHYLVELVFWRLYYVLPLPLCAGIAGSYLLFRRTTPGAPARFAVAIVAIFLVGASVERTVLSSRNQVTIKPPWEYRLDPIMLAYSRRLLPQLRHRTVLAPNRLANVLALTEPIEVTLVRARVEGGDPLERALDRCHLLQRAKLIARAALSNNADVIALRPCRPNIKDDLELFLRGPRLRLIPIETPKAVKLVVFEVIRTD